MTKQILTVLAGLAVIGVLSGCTSKPQQVTVMSGPVAQVAETDSLREIAPDDPIWNDIALKQQHLDRVEKNRTGQNDAHSCQRAVPGPNHRVKIDTSACAADQLRAERDAERTQLLDRASQMMNDRR